MAVTLIIENQNSISPNIFTEIRLARKRITRKAPAEAHWGTLGHQYLM